MCEHSVGCCGLNSDNIWTVWSGVDELKPEAIDGKHSVCFQYQPIL